MKQNVLVVEDSLTSMRLLKRVIGKAKLRAVAATSLTEAKHIFATTTPESYLCAIVDYTLPDAQNGEAIDFAIESYIPVIVITGRIEESIRDRVLSKEVVDYIPKENTQVYEYLSRLLSRLEMNKQVGVLVVDDSRVSRNKMLSLLHRHNFITYGAADGQEALEILEESNNIKLVITDENMPNKTGVELVADIRRKYGKDELSVIGLSSDHSSALSARFIKSGANDYLTKPYCHEEFFCRVMQNVEHVEHIETIRRVANSDYLTGLPNRRHFFSEVNTLMRKNPADCCLALIDLDHFKSVNDNYGHDGGDHVLKEVAKRIGQHFNQFVPARFGGEEFCIFFAGIGIQEAYDLLDSFRQDIAGTEMSFNDTHFNCTLSIGLTAQHSNKVESMLSVADQHLYRAKELGRNMVVADDTF